MGTKLIQYLPRSLIKEIARPITNYIKGWFSSAYLGSNYRAVYPPIDKAADAFLSMGQFERAAFGLALLVHLHTK